MRRIGAVAFVCIVAGCPDSGGDDPSTSGGTTTFASTSSTGPMPGDDGSVDDGDDDGVDDGVTGGADSTGGDTSPSSSTDGGASSDSGPADTSDSGSGGSESGSSTTGEAIEPYGDCTPDCLEGETCVLTPIGNVCAAVDCASERDCAPPPPGGDASVICQDATGNGVDDCLIDCSGGAACPTGMTCFSEQICVWPDP